MELKGTRHLVLAWVPIILAAMIIGGIIAIALNTILRQLGLDLPYIAEFIGSLAGALALAFVLKKTSHPSERSAGLGTVSGCSQSLSSTWL